VFHFGVIIYVCYGVWGSVGVPAGKVVYRGVVG